MLGPKGEYEDLASFPPMHLPLNPNIQVVGINPGWLLSTLSLSSTLSFFFLNFFSFFLFRSFSTSFSLYFAHYCPENVNIFKSAKAPLGLKFKTVHGTEYGVCIGRRKEKEEREGGERKEKEEKGGGKDIDLLRFTGDIQIRR
jgi:hypothetical protein